MSHRLHKEITVEQVLDAKRDTLSLEILTPEAPLTGTVADPDVSSPGLALAGYTARFPSGRMQVFGETEMTYLGTLEPSMVEDRLRELFSHEIPAVFVSKSLAVPDIMLELAQARGIPVFRSALSTKLVYRRLKPYLEWALAPSTTIHGSLADVYGVGLLFVGKSGIGKSECVLDLVERGHRLVADDLIIATRRGNDVVIGRGHERQGHHMEIRGIGIIDVRALFGIRAIRLQKRVEVVVQLEAWDNRKAYDRTGLDPETTEILGVEFPKVIVPLNPGKNITVIAEVIAMNHLLKYAGVNSASEFDQLLQESMRTREYLEEDYE